MTIQTELPEVETIRYALDREVAGRKVKTVEAASMAVLGHYRNRRQFASRLEGRKLGPVRRMGLLLLSELDDDQLLVIKLGPGAQMRRNGARDLLESGTEITVTFTVGGQLRLVDPGGGSQVCVISGDDLVAEFPEVAAVGMDPAGEMIPWTSFGGQVLARSMPLKDLLCDSSIVVGVGDVYSDEILFHAGLRHDRRSDSLSHQEVRRLHGALIQV